MLTAVMLFSVAQAILPAPVSDVALGRRLTAAAEDLFAAERKAAAAWKKAARSAEPGTDAGDGVDYILYDDVLSLLDAALKADPQNLHAHTLAADILLLKAYEGEGTYDACTLLDARSEAEFVTSRASRAASDDLAVARAVLRSIAGIPPDQIPDTPPSCDEEDEQHHGSRSGTKTG